MSSGTGPLLRSITTLAELPLAQACGLGPTLANDFRALSAGHTPRLRVALTGDASAVDRLTAYLRRSLPSDAVRLGARPADCHQLLHVVLDGPVPQPPGAAPTRSLLRSGAPRACVVVVAEDDWGGLGTAPVTRWHRDRLWAGPEPWRSVPVRTVVLPSLLGGLLDEELLPTVEQRNTLVAELVRVRLTRALWLIAEAARDVTAADPPVDAWLRMQARTAGPPTHRLLRLLRGFQDGTRQERASERADTAHTAHTAHTADTADTADTAGTKGTKGSDGRDGTGRDGEVA